MFDSLAATHPLLPTIAGSLILILAALVADLITKRLLLVAVRAVASRTRSEWDDALVRYNAFGRLAQIVPAAIVHAGAGWVPGLSEVVIKVTHNVANAWMILMVTLTLAAVLKAGNWIYERRPASRNRPIKGFVQIVEIAIYAFGGVLVIGALLDRSPLVLLSGMGALSAVLMFVFKDTLVSLMASLQLSGQDMVRVDRRRAVHGDGAELGQDHHQDPDLQAGLRFVQELARHVGIRWSADQALDPYRSEFGPFSDRRGDAALHAVRAAQRLYPDQAGRAQSL
jgi:miniconductance mechanosensitive channel